MRVDRFGHGVGYALHRLEVREARATDRLGRAEVRQQRPLARRANPRDVVKRRGRNRLGPFRAVCPDGKAVRLIAQALHEI